MSKFDPIRAVGIHGLNYDLSTEAIITRLEEWDRRFGVSIESIEADACTIRFERLPDDLLAFADDEIGMFCPDVIFQGFDSVEALADDLKRTHTLFLWWD